MYTSETLHCVSLNSVNAYEVSDKNELLYRDISFTEVDRDYKVSEGLGIDALWLGGILILFFWEAI